MVLVDIRGVVLGSRYLYDHDAIVFKLEPVSEGLPVVTMAVILL